MIDTQTTTNMTNTEKTSTKTSTTELIELNDETDPYVASEEDDEDFVMPNEYVNNCQ